MDMRSPFHKLIALVCVSTSGLGAAHAQLKKMPMPDGDAWWRVAITARNEADVQRLADCPYRLFSDNLAIGENDFIVSSNDFLNLAQMGLSYRIQNLMPAPNGFANIARDDIDFHTTYLTGAQILAQYEAWRAAYPNMISRTQIGTSRENRPIYAYRIAWGARSGSKQPSRSVFVEAGIHAREWITPATGLYIFEQFIKKVNTDRRWQRANSNVAFYMVPVLNVDGYEYSWTTDRYWRKNRRNNGNGTYGVDLNRNFSKGWGGSGSSSSSSSDTYRGPSAFSEPESAAVRNYIAAIEPPAAFLDLHSYSQLVLRPWGYVNAFSPSEATLKPIGDAMASAIAATTGKVYTSEAAYQLYIASGTTQDWEYSVYANSSWTIEMRDTGQYGFVLPADQIYPTQLEIWAAFEKMFFMSTGY